MKIIAAYGVMCLIWGTTWLAIKVGLHTLGPLTGVGLRFIIASAFLFALAAITRQLRPLRELPWDVIAVFAGLLFGGNYILTYTAETHLDSGLVAVLFGTLPFFTFAFAHFMVRERTTARTWLGTALAFVGIAVISLSHQVRALPIYALAAIAAAGVSSFANVYAKRHAHHHPLTTLPFSMLIAGAIVFAMGLLFERTDWNAAAQSSSLLSLLYLAVFGSGVAFLINMWLLQRIAVWIVGVSSLIFPVVALAAGTLLGGETLTWYEVAGTALVIAGLAAALVTPGAPAVSEETI